MNASVQTLVRRLRKRGVSAAEIAKEVGVAGPRIIYTWAAGKVRYPRIKSLRRLEDLATRLHPN